MQSSFVQETFSIFSNNFKLRVEKLGKIRWNIDTLKKPSNIFPLFASINQDNNSNSYGNFSLSSSVKFSSKFFYIVIIFITYINIYYLLLLFLYQFNDLFYKKMFLHFKLENNKISYDRSNIYIYIIVSILFQIN